MEAEVRRLGCKIEKEGWVFYIWISKLVFELT